MWRPRKRPCCDPVRGTVFLLDRPGQLFLSCSMDRRSRARDIQILLCSPSRIGRHEGCPTVGAYENLRVRSTPEEKGECKVNPLSLIHSSEPRIRTRI